jgi:hypothetical protein
MELEELLDETSSSTELEELLEELELTELELQFSI